MWRVTWVDESAYISVTALLEGLGLFHMLSVSPCAHNIYLYIRTVCTYVHANTHMYMCVFACTCIRVCVCVRGLVM